MEYQDSRGTMRALITAGGTSEPIDDVRVVTNLSTGSFGAAIANALAERSVAVTVIGSRAMLRHVRLHPSVRTVPYGSFVELREALQSETEDPPDLLFMAAAVSDYAPLPVAGKIRSHSDTMTVEMRRNPKLLTTLRARCPDAFLVGFKLLSGVARSELIDVARQQLTHAHLDLTVANDAATFAPGVHPILLVTAEHAEPHTGSKDEVARALADHVLARVRRHDDAGLSAGPDVPGHATWHLDDILTSGELVQEGSITDTLARGGWRGGPFVVRGAGGVVVGSRSPRLLDDLDATWPGEGPLAFVDGLPVGRWVHRGEQRSVWIAPHLRGQGYGDRLVRALGRRPEPVFVEPAHLPFFIERGFEPGPVLTPPCRRTLLPAASVCLVDVLGGRVLLGQRQRGAYLHWWSFPGGGQEPGESPLDCARRELYEETGLQITTAPIHQHPIAVGDGERAWSLQCFVIPVLGAPSPHDTDELHARWLPFDQALALPQVTAGTRSVIRSLAR